VRVLIDDLEAEIIGAKLVPGLVGVYSVEAKVPDSITSNSAARLVVQVNGLESQPVILSTSKTP